MRCIHSEELAEMGLLAGHVLVLLSSRTYEFIGDSVSS